MANQTLVEFLKGIADAIRTKDKTTAKIPASAMKSRILAIQTGTDTSDATATASDIVQGKTAYIKTGKVTGTKNVALQSKTVTPATSQQVVTPDSGYYGLSSVTVEEADFGQSVYYFGTNSSDGSITPRNSSWTFNFYNIPSFSKITAMCGLLGDISFDMGSYSYIATFGRRVKGYDSGTEIRQMMTVIGNNVQENFPVKLSLKVLSSSIRVVVQPTSDAFGNWATVLWSDVIQGYSSDSISNMSVAGGTAYGSSQYAAFYFEHS